MLEFRLGDIVVLAVDHCEMPLWIEANPDGTFVRQRSGSIRPGELALVLGSREIDAFYNAMRSSVVRIVCGGGSGWIGGVLLEEVEQCW